MLKTSYEVLKHEKTRKLFDDSLVIRIHQNVVRDYEIERFSRRFKDEVARISAQEAKKRRANQAKKIVVPLQRAEQTDFIPKSNLDDQAFEDQVMQRVLKAAKKQKIMMEI
ncbi:unnamed protein product [Arabis nemorensis]|uniref:Uncharacterized protein n=1 Tax=Arabis nemorensis TaxID=586526 RepID=A0A565CFU4_9BRAS|nr:unnamed protein product [Arabis nemorensis]